jgi:hypothetical protein
MIKGLKSFFKGFISGGMINLIIGIYYAIIKAGLPYQDPPSELQFEYAVNTEIGVIMTEVGLVMCLIGIIGVVMFKIIEKKKRPVTTV